MTALSWALLALAAAELAFGLWQWVSRRRTLRRLNAMLDRAIAGGFFSTRRRLPLWRGSWPGSSGAPPPRKRRWRGSRRR